MPIWEGFAEAMSDENVDVARMNVAENDIPPEFAVEYQGTGYPAIYFKASLHHVCYPLVFRSKRCN